MTVEDEGVFVRQVSKAEPDEKEHRGIRLMETIMDEVTIDEGSLKSPGTGVRLVKHKTGPAEMERLGS